MQRDNPLDVFTKQGKLQNGSTSKKYLFQVSWQRVVCFIGPKRTHHATVWMRVNFNPSVTDRYKKQSPAFHVPILLRSAHGKPPKIEILFFKSISLNHQGGLKNYNIKVLFT